jgi:hypothetical protein
MHTSLSHGKKNEVLKRQNTECKYSKHQGDHRTNEAATKTDEDDNH